MHLLLCSRKCWVALGVALTFLCVHLFPFVFFRQTLVLGFDTGFYRRYLIEPFTSIPHASVPGLDHTVIIPRIFLDLVRATGVTTDIALYGGYILAAGFLCVTFFLFVRTFLTRQAAFLAVLLLLLAPVYYHGYWFFLLKNFLALGLFFLLLYCIQRSHVAPAVLLGVLIPITHQSTTVLAGIFFFVSAILYGIHKKPWKLLAAMWAAVFAVYLLYHPTVSAKITSPPSAIFLDTKVFLLYTWPLLALLLFRIRTAVAFLKLNQFLATGLLITAIFIIGQIPYYQRVYLFGIFFLVPLCAQLLEGLWVEEKKRVPVLIFITCYALYGAYWMTEHTPYMDTKTEQALERLAELPSDAHVITPNYLASWVQGYTTSMVFAPGVFKDQATPENWQAYWSHRDEVYDREFLNVFPAPLYFFIPGEHMQHFLPNAACITQFSTHVYLYTCHESN